MRAPAQSTSGYALGLALALTALVGCEAGSTGTSTGNPNDGSSSGPGLPGGHGPMEEPIPGIGDGGEGGALGGYCKADASVLAGTTASTPLGFTAADVLAFAEGSHHETIRWHDNQLATFGPEKGEHTVTIVLGYDGGEVRLMTPRDDGGSSGEIEPAIAIDRAGGCQPWIEIDVHVSVQTDGGALDESFDATLRTRHELFATVFTHPDPDELGGSFAPEEIFQPGFELAQLDLSIGFTPFGVSGSLDGVFEMRTGDSVGASPGGRDPFADFGRSGCDYNGFAVALDDMIEQASAQDMLDVLGGAHDLAIAWNDGTSTTATLAFARAQDGACVLLDDRMSGDVTIVVDGTMELVSEDGQLDASWPVSARTDLGESGAIDQVELLLDLQGEPPPVSDSLPEVDVSEYDSALFSFMLTVAADGTDAANAMGELRVLGLKFADCATNPAPSEPIPDVPADMQGGAGSVPPSMGSGSPGCRGADMFELLSGAITLQ